MGGRLSRSKPNGFLLTEDDYYKAARLKLANACQLVGTQPVTQELQACIHEASALFEEAIKDPRAAGSDFDAIEEKLRRAFSIIGSIPEDSEDINKSLGMNIQAAQEALAGAAAARKQEELSSALLQAMEASEAASKALSTTKSSNIPKAELKKTRSKLSQAVHDLTRITIDDGYGNGATSEEVAAASIKVQEVLESIDNIEMEAKQKGDLPPEWHAAKKEMLSASKSLEKRLSIK